MGQGDAMNGRDSLYCDNVSVWLPLTVVDADFGGIPAFVDAEQVDWSWGTPAHFAEPEKTVEVSSSPTDKSSGPEPNSGNIHLRSASFLTHATSSLLIFYNTRLMDISLAAKKTRFQRTKKAVLRLSWMAGWSAWQPDRVFDSGSRTEAMWPL